VLVVSNFYSTGARQLARDFQSQRKKYSSKVVKSSVGTKKFGKPWYM
jgi:hypothetical protein